MLDTAATYSGGKNEMLVGSVLKRSRDKVFLASKAGMYKNPDGSREIDGDPDRIIRSCNESLSRLGTDVIDLCSICTVSIIGCRWKSLSALLIVSYLTARSDTLGSLRSVDRRLSGLRPSPKSTRYSQSTRCGLGGWKMACSSYCEANSIALVAYSPVGRGFLAGGVRDMARLSERDIRHGMPRFQGDAFTNNLTVLEHIEMLGLDWGMTLAQVCLNWLWSRGDHVGAIPGTSELSHWRDDQGATTPLSARTGKPIRELAS